MVKSKDVSCCYCHRSRDKVLASSVGGTARRGAVVDLFYIESDGYLVCERCVSEDGKLLQNGGKPVIIYDADRAVYRVAERKLSMANLKPVPKEMVDVLAGRW